MRGQNFMFHLYVVLAYIQDLYTIFTFTKTSHKFLNQPKSPSNKFCPNLSPIK